MACHPDENDTQQLDHEYDSSSDHDSEYDDEDDGSWIEVSSSGSSSEDGNDEGDDLSYDVSIHDELSWFPSEKLEHLPEVIISKYESLQLRQPRGKGVSDAFPLPPTTSSTKWQRTRGYLWSATKVCCLLCSLVIAKLALHPSTISLDFDLRENEQTIYVPGVGFSGFWFSLGRLKSISDPTSNHYVCFSAGCLGSVAILNGFSLNEMACMAQSAQLSWKDGHISRYDVVSSFVDGLVYRKFPIGPGGDALSCLERFGLVDSSDRQSDNNHGSTSLTTNTTTSTNLGQNADLLSRLHVLTTTTSMKASMRSPKTLLELREMLIQTTWM